MVPVLTCIATYETHGTIRIVSKNNILFETKRFEHEPKTNRLQMRKQNNVAEKIKENLMRINVVCELISSCHEKANAGKR